MLSDLSVEFFQNDSFESLAPYETKTTGLGLFRLEVYELHHHTASLNPLTFPISWTQITTAAGLAATQTTNQVLLVCNNYTSRIICIYILYPCNYFVPITPVDWRGVAYQYHLRRYLTASPRPKMGSTPLYRIHTPDQNCPL